MFGVLTEKMQGLMARLSGRHKLTEENIAEAATEVRLALLEADVNYGVVKELIRAIKQKALGDAVLKSVSPGQQFIKIVHDELVSLMGVDEIPLDLSVKPTIIMMCGLQGAGKTTQCVKLARFYVKQGLAKNPLLVACDLQRPAAVDQLRLLAQQVSLPVFSIPGQKDPLQVATAALQEIKRSAHDLVIVDTAGRLHIDEPLMQQLEQMQKILQPHHILFVANAATGQEAANVAAQFNTRVPVSGSILTMLDGNTRGGAAISIRHVTGKPLLFEGVGEKIDDLQIFHPQSMADRILGMGDTINLVKKAQEHISEEDAKQLEQKMRTATFTYEDYLTQIQSIKKMGSLKSLLGMFPGMNMLKEIDIDDKEFFKIEAIIQSMTPDERAERCELTPSRRKRIAKGSGTSLEAINKLLKSFKKAKQMFKNMPNMKQLQKMMGGGTLWH
jgi:signal recognition particle subunit SRP54